MRFSTRFVAVIVGMLVAGTAWAQGTGRSLDIQPGARENGMGATGVALGDDATGATWWNPAALGFTTQPSIQLTTAQLVPGLASDVTFNEASYVHPVAGWGAFGLSLAFLSYGSSEAINEAGQSNGRFDSYEVWSGVSYGTKLFEDLSIGATVKYVRIQLAPASYQGVGSTFGLDLATLYKIPAARLRFGLNVQNLGPSVTFINEDQSSPLSRNLKVGYSWQVYDTKPVELVVTSDYNQSLVTNDFKVWNHGLELKYAEQIAGRIGWYSDPLGNIKDFTYGIGIVWKNLALDYGSIPQAKDSNLPNVNKISIGYRF